MNKLTVSLPGVNQKILCNIDRDVVFVVLMKTPIFLAALAFLPVHQIPAEEIVKPLMSIQVKRHLLDTNSGRTLGVESRKKTYSLRVEITNVSSSTVESSELAGEVLVKRAVDDREKLVKERLAPVKLSAMKPNQKVTIDLGEIHLTKIEWKLGGKEFEENIAEWKVVCTKGGKEIGGHLSSKNYDKLEKEVRPTIPDMDRRGPMDRRRPMDERERKLHRLMN